MIRMYLHEFNDNGVCNYCEMIDDLKEEYGTGKEKGKKSIQENNTRN